MTLRTPARIPGEAATAEAGGGAPGPAAVPPPAVAAPAGPRRAAGRLRALDGLRLLAALAVCLYHYAGRGGEVTHSWGRPAAELFPHLSRVAVYGNFGVQLFFVISGFVICMSSWGRTVEEFFRSRVARLYPAYWAAIVLVTAASVAMPSVVRQLRPDEILVNLTMLQQPVGARRVLGVCWTLWVELRFYVLFALLVVWRGITRRRVVVFCCLWTVAAVLAAGARLPLLDEIVMSEYAPYFIGGLALYLIHRHGGDALLWGIVTMSWLLAQYLTTEGLWSWYRVPGGDFPHRDPYVVMGIVTLSFAAVAVVALGRPRRADWRWLSVAGALTYPFYLVHEHLGWFAIDVLRRHAGLSPAWTLAATVVAMLALAWVMHRWVEKPFGPRLKRSLAGRAEPSADRADGPARQR